MFNILSKKVAYALIVGYLQTAERHQEALLRQFEQASQRLAKEIEPHLSGKTKELFLLPSLIPSNKNKDEAEKQKPLLESIIEQALLHEFASEGKGGGTFVISEEKIHALGFSTAMGETGSLAEALKEIEKATHGFIGGVALDTDTYRIRKYVAIYCYCDSSKCPIRK